MNTTTNTQTAPSTDDQRTMNLGFTQYNELTGYYPAMHGFRSLARQEILTLVLPEDTFFGYELEEAAEAAFEATNSPYPEGFTGLTKVIYDEINRMQAKGAGIPMYLRSLSVGDTVEIHAQLAVVEGVGFRRY